MTQTDKFNRGTFLGSIDRLEVAEIIFYCRSIGATVHQKQGLGLASWSSNRMQLKTLEDTTLWKRLNGLGDSISTYLSSNLLVICKDACDRMKAMPSFAPNYTLHDETHLLRTTELMALILGKVLPTLNPVEIALLILSAHFHDQGMIPNVEEYKELNQVPEYVLFRDNWYIEHPNRNEIAQQLGNHTPSKQEELRLLAQLSELDSAMLTDYLRSTHGFRGAEFLRSRYATDKRFEVDGISLVELVAKLCASHCESTENLTPSNGFRFDEQVSSYSVNMPFLAVILRLADILDFDRERTPDALYRTIHFTSDVSLREWEKHRGVHGWTVSEERIRFNVQYDHPIYEAAARQYMDAIDVELSNSLELCRQFPSEFAHYKLRLPQKVDRSRIGPKNNAYIYHDLEFSLSRDEIVRLLMTHNLYSDSSICIRELLQNALDALRYRKALFACKGIEWKDGLIRMEHSIDKDGYEIIRCSDNGVGMDDGIITRFLTKVGRSFYRSPEFEQQRVEFRRYGEDFDPCSKFGIGFMSYFMLGDRIKVETRRDYGMGKTFGAPLIIEINGLSSMLVIRKGSSSQPVGTTVTIVSRKKPSFFDEWVDNVSLTSILRGYALATEFPIQGKCSIPEIADEVLIPTKEEKVPTLLEFAEVKNIITFEQLFSEIDERLNGTLRESFLINQDGVPCIQNAEASWKIHKIDTSGDWQLYKHDSQRVEHYPWERDMPVCIDGILVAGPPGRPGYSKETMLRLGHLNSQIYGSGATILDVRGEIKPELTPARTPPNLRPFKLSPGWQRLQHYVNKASGRLWTRVIRFIDSGMSHEDFWKLSEVYKVRLSNIPHQILWELIAVSTIGVNGNCEWRKVSELGKLSLKADNKSLQLITENQSKIGPEKSFEEWSITEDKTQLGWRMNSLVVLMSSAIIESGSIYLVPRYPINQNDVLSEYIISSPIGVSAFLMPFLDEASNAVTVQTHFPLLNRLHPLSSVFLDSNLLARKSDIQEFASNFLPFIAQSVSLRDNDVCIEKPGRWHKHVAHLYFDVTWSNYDVSLKPPYKIWLQDKGWQTIDENHFAHWK